MIRRLLLLGTAGAASLFAGYTYDVPSSWYQSSWQLNGNVTFGGSGSDSFPPDSSMIYTQTVSGANPNDYELESTLIPGTSTAIHFLRAGSASVQAGVGSYISVELTPLSGGTYQMSVNQCVSGVVTNLAGSTVSNIPGSPAANVLRTIVWGTNLRVFFSGQDVLDMTIPLTTGNPGVGAEGGWAYLSAVKVGHHDTVAPNPVAAEPVGTSLLPTKVSLAWPVTSDDSIGIGMFRYQITRNGTLIGYAPGTDYTDNTAQASTSYTYLVSAEDQHGNVSSPLTLTLTTPPAMSVDPRRTGVRSSGSYWGGGGEQIDVLSGNLNFSLPVLTTQQRTGQKFPLSLNYNSQNWRQAGGINWQLGGDIGYGFGWRLQFGSLTPYYAGLADGVDHYVFTDGTGADYRLDVNTGGVWSSSQSVYVWFDSNTGLLHFNDGSFWVMGCTSGGLEPDAGTMYPTTLEDVSGNQITIVYNPAAPLSPLYYHNSSGRIYTIQDFRGLYQFTYNTDAPVPHLTTVMNYIGTAENYTLTYASSALSPPFGSDPTYAGATTTLLSTMTVPTVPSPYSFTYDPAGAGELLQATFPYGGHLGWGYQSFLYAGPQSLREVGARTLAADSAGANVWTYALSRDDSANPNPTVHANLTLVDASGIGAKTWNFYTANTSGVSPWQVGLLSSFVQQSAAGGTVFQRDTFTWAQDGANNPYIGSKLTVLDEAGSNPQTQRSDQTLDQYGNVTQSVQYAYNNTTTPIRTYNNTYLYSLSSTATPYLPNYVFNRLLSTVLTMSTGNKTLVTNAYDYVNTSGQPPWTSGASLDPNPPVPVSALGLLWESTTPAVTTTTYYWDTGLPFTVTRSDGKRAAFSADAATNYSAPMSISTESYSQSVSYNSWLGITQTTGANGETLTMTYDRSGRPTTGVSPFGAVTTYTYSPASCVPASACPAAPAQWQQQTGPTGVTTTILDGMGRTIRVERGDTNGVQSIVDTVYAPCACSPLGKIQKVSQPYAPGGTPVWTVYTYDGLGRTVSVLQPDGASAATTAYSGNQTTATDAAGNWKTFTKDVLGNLTTVTEPDPSSMSGGTLTTSYAYDWMNHLSQVTMTRGSTTQTRTFNYSDAGLLTSATNPENGAVSYYYNTDTTLQYKHDAKGQDTVYTYDSAKRVTMIQKYPSGKNNSEDTCQRVTYTYGTSPSTYNYSRLTTRQYQTCVPGGYPISYADQYSYNAAGAVTSRQLQMTRDESDWDSGGSPLTRTATVGYTYNSAGTVSSVSYPMPLVDPEAAAIAQCYGLYWCNPGTYPPPAETLGYSFDTMGRPSALTDNYATTAYLNYAYDYPLPSGVYIQWAQNAQYDAAGRLDSLQYLTGVTDNGYGTSTQSFATESMAFNANGQLTSLNFANTLSGGLTGGIQYSYSATQNNGQITQATDTISGETIAYQYDALKRLTSASSTPTSGSAASPWTESFSYDGFGNMTGQTLNGTQSSIPVNGQTNQLTSAAYDANGNMTTGAGATTLTYDVANRLTSAAEVSGGIEYYGYAPDGKQVYRLLANGSEEFTLYGVQGEKLGVYAPIITSEAQAIFQPLRANVYFAGRVIWADGAPAYQDRLGTNRAQGARFLPYGNEITATTNDREKFATYTRDSYTGLDYAVNRYYSSLYGRFLTRDSSSKSARGRSPQTWNRYTYASGDPVNRNDPRGLCDDVIGGITQASSNANALNQFASDIGAIQAFPYASGSRSALLGGIAGLSQVAYQALFTASASTFSAFMSVMAAAQDSGPINIFTFSGGAQAFASAYQYLPASVQGRINNITYVSPGAVSGSPLPAGSGSTTAIFGASFSLSGAVDVATTFFAQLPLGTQIIDTPCGHESFCEFDSAIDALDANVGNACSAPSTISTGPDGSVEQVSSWVLWDASDDDEPPSHEQVSSSISFYQP